MGVDYVSLMACADIMVSDYTFATKSKLSNQAAEKTKSTFFDKLVEQEQQQLEQQQSQAAYGHGIANGDKQDNC